MNSVKHWVRRVLMGAFLFIMQEGRKPVAEESNETKSHQSDDEYEGGLC
jgi:hypothetical protein